MEQAFETWMAKVDLLLEEETGFDSDSNVDYTWWDCWNEGHSPKSAVKEYLNSQFCW